MSLTLLQRLHNAQRQVDYIQKEKKQGMRYSIVSHDAVTAKVRPVLKENGIIYYPVNMHYTQEGNRTQVQLAVRFANADNGDDYIDVQSLGYGVDDSDKGPGKAISYAVKYALLKALGLETGDDPDYDQDAKYERHKPTGATTSPAIDLERPTLPTLPAKKKSATESLPGASTELAKEYTPDDVLKRLTLIMQTNPLISDFYTGDLDTRAKKLGKEMRSMFNCKTSTDFMLVPEAKILAELKAMEDFQADPNE